MEYENKPVIFFALFFGSKKVVLSRAKLYKPSTWFSWQFCIILFIFIANFFLILNFCNSTKLMHDYLKVVCGVCYLLIELYPYRNLCYENTCLFILHSLNFSYQFIIFERQLRLDISAATSRLLPTLNFPLVPINIFHHHSNLFLTSSPF